MKGKTCLVTGATSGIGFETACGIAQLGATLVVVGRTREKCLAAADQIKKRTANPNVDGLAADLSDQKEIRRLATEFKSKYSRLHVLVNNAGGMFLNGQVNAAGVEMTLALNHLAYYLLTNLLLDVLIASAPARIINVSSLAHTGVHIDFSNFRFGGWKGYKRSKLANILFTYELARRLEGSGVTVNTLHPGLVASGFGANNRGFFPLIKPLVNCFAVTNEQGARTSIYLASLPEVEGVTGKYFAKCRAERSSDASYDRVAAERLWKTSAAMTGLAEE
jgi:NAD(P)-dependent dehydrogenase (short-subunit alcohol dehydrogenase family)